MRKIIFMLFAIGCLCGLQSCNDDETYAEKREKERDAISAFLKRDVAIVMNGDTLIDVGAINVISEDQFYRQDSMTNVANNEYVLFENTGIYMQIVRKGTGSKLLNGQTKSIICRYVEYNILTDAIQSNSSTAYPDIMDVTNTYGTFQGSFNTSINGGGVMYNYYGSKAVPSGWLVPLTYICIGRQIDEREIAKVRIIVPHNQGHSDASSNVYPCFYEISYQETAY